MRRGLSKKRLAEAELLFELGTEEMPVTCLREGMNQLSKALKVAFGAFCISYKEKNIRVFATPCRLVLYIEGVPSRQTSYSWEIIGPSKQAAFDKDGNPTAAYKGFAKSHGAALEDVKIKHTPKGEYLYIVKESPSEWTVNLLPKILKEIVLRLEFPKTMRWDESGLRFPRPIRWLLAIYTDKERTKTIRFQVYRHLKSEDFTFINRSRVRIRNIKDYFEELKRANILLDPKERSLSIVKQIKIILNKKLLRRRGEILWDDEKIQGLLNEVTFLTESPKVLLGEYGEEYSKELPLEILSACLSKYQRLFGILDLLNDYPRQRLMPYFFGVVNGNFDKKILDNITKNYEHILDARLKDALFFYNEDIKTRLNERIESLKGLIFLEGLGSMYEKTQRVKDLSMFIANELELSEDDKQNVMRSAILCKTDLTTLMVKEFPSLQGIVGRIYANLQGENNAVADAIREHYQPLPDGGRPGSIISYCLFVADKLDTLIGYFGMGLTPTSSEDPHGLKRCANGVISVIVNMNLEGRLLLKRLIDYGIGLFKGRLIISADAMKSNLTDYLKERFEEIFKNHGIDIIHAAIDRDFDDIYLVWYRIDVLRSIRKEDYFKKACKVVERTNNILKGTKDELGSVDIAKFCEPLEKELWQIYDSNKDRVERYIKDQKIEDATRFYGEAFYDIINKFFDKVLVNVEDDGVRRNRLSLMMAIRDLYTKNIADISCILYD